MSDITAIMIGEHGFSVERRGEFSTFIGRVLPDGSLSILVQDEVQCEHISEMEPVNAMFELTRGEAIALHDWLGRELDRANGTIRGEDPRNITGPWPTLNVGPGGPVDWGLDLTMLQEQAERLTRPDGLGVTVKKSAWSTPVKGDHFEFQGREWCIDEIPIDKGEGWEISAFDVRLRFAMSGPPIR